MGGERDKANLTPRLISKNGGVISPVIRIADSLCKSHSVAILYKTSVGT